MSPEQTRITRLEASLRSLMKAYAACNGEDDPAYTNAEAVLSAGVLAANTSEEGDTLVRLAKAVIEHAPEGVTAFQDIKFSDIEAALSTDAPTSNRKPVVPMLGTRFKLSFDSKGRCTTFRKDQAEKLFGEWVWLIEATNGMNDPLYAAPTAPVVTVEAPIGWTLAPIKPLPRQLETAAFNLSAEFGPEFVLAHQSFARAVYRELLAAISPQSADGTTGRKIEDNPLMFFAENVDKWGALQWFERIVGAAAMSDKAALEWWPKKKNGEDCIEIEMRMETAKNIMSSSALQLARNYAGEIRSALSSQMQSETVAEIVSAHGDPEAFGERELVARVDIQKFPYGTKLYAAKQGDAA